MLLVLRWRPHPMMATSLVFQAAEEERPIVDWQSDEGKCLEELGLDKDCHDDILCTIAAIVDGVHVTSNLRSLHNATDSV